MTVSNESSDVKETAQEQAQQVVGTTKDEATQVVATAKEQVGAVTADVRDQTRQLADDARTQLMEHAGSQRDRAVESLRSVADELSGMTQSAEGSGLGVQLVREGGDITHRVADFLQEREPGQLVDELRSFARRRPAAFLLGAAVAGVVVGRLAQGARSAHSSDDVSSDSTTASPAVTRQPADVLPVAEADAWGPGSVDYPVTPITGVADGSATDGSPRVGGAW